MKPFTSDCLGRLQEAADFAIDGSYINTFGWRVRRNLLHAPPEEDFVASLVLFGLPLLDRLWRPLLQKWRIRLTLTGVFCHQTPKAKYVRVFPRDQDLIDRLVMACTPKGWPLCCPWAMMLPKQSGWVEEPLPVFLVKLLNFEAGREFFERGTTGCHWSELVHFLLETTFSLPLRTRDIRAGATRGMAIGFSRRAFMGIDDLLASAYVPEQSVLHVDSGGESGSPDQPEEAFDEGGEGRVIIIETSEAEGRE